MSLDVEDIFFLASIAKMNDHLLHEVHDKDTYVAKK